MNEFSTKTLIYLGEQEDEKSYYVYGLMDPRNNQLFYIGKGYKNRVFNHEKEDQDNRNKQKLIADIHKSGKEVKKIIIKSQLTEKQAFEEEGLLISIFNYLYPNLLTNKIEGHHIQHILSVEEFDKQHGAEPLLEEDIKHNILIVKVNETYKPDMDPKDIYEIVRGLWTVDLSNAEKVEYVFGVYKSLIVGVYKPTQWYTYKDHKDKLLQRQKLVNGIEDIPNKETRKFFEDKGFENGEKLDDNQQFYLGKSIENLNLKTRNSIRYIL